MRFVKQELFALVADCLVCGCALVKSAALRSLKVHTRDALVVCPRCELDDKLSGTEFEVIAVVLLLPAVSVTVENQQVAVNVGFRWGSYLHLHADDPFGYSVRANLDCTHFVVLL